MGQNRAISVKGSAKLTGTPDWVVIVFNVESESYYYEECAEMLAERTGILKKELISLGIENENPKPFILTSTPSSIGLTEGVSSGDTRLPTS